jgi:hypothetical protein
VQALAAWLVARPQNAVIVLAATLLIPYLQVLSGIIMVLLVLRQGTRLAIFEGAAAGALVAVIGLIAGAPVAQLFGSMLTTWAPAIVLGGVLHATRSLTLTMQVSMLIAIFLTIAFHVIVADPVAYWQPVTTYMLEWARQSNLQEQVQLMESDPVMTANMVTIAIVLSSWMLYVLYLLFGYHVFKQMAGEKGDYGRFCDLNFGRVLALIMALVSLLAVASGVFAIQNVAFLLFAMFWIQGLAILHWMHFEGRLPLFVVIVTYILLPVLHVFLILALAVLGYTDAWFRYRRRVVREQ